MVTREDIDIYKEEVNELVNNIFNGSFMSKYSDVVGSFTADIVRAFSTELIVQQKLYEEMSKNYNIATAEGLYLDSICSEDYIFRKKATAATGTVRVYGISGTLIENGMMVVSNNCTYTIIETKIVAYKSTGTVGYSDVNVVANIAGEVGNCGIGEINKFFENYAGLEKVENLNNISNGSNQETDEELRERRKKILSSPSVNYNTNMIKEMILSNFENIKKLRIIPRWNGKGTAKIIGIGKSDIKLKDEELNTIKGYLDSEIITDAEFTIKTIKEKSINLAFEAILNKEYSEEGAIDLTKSTLNQVFLNKLFEENRIYYAEIIDKLLEVKAFKKISNIDINNAKEDIILDDEDLVSVSNVTLKTLD
jgi:baseplate J-like protein